MAKQNPQSAIFKQLKEHVAGILKKSRPRLKSYCNHSDGTDTVIHNLVRDVNTVINTLTIAAENSLPSEMRPSSK